MKSISLITLAALTASLCVAEPICILPLGDSITQGGKRDREEYTYRWPLFQILVDNEVEFDFVGSRNQGLHRDATWPESYRGVPFDLDHEGIYGVKTQRALVHLRDRIDQWDAAPDIALIHLGTNDRRSDDHVKSVKEPLRELILLLREQNPEVVIILGHLNFNDGPAKESIRPLVNELAAEMNTDDSPVLTVNHFEDWQENPKHPGADTFDWAHPNPQGQRKMAEKWYAAMKPYLQKRDGD